MTRALIAGHISGLVVGVGAIGGLVFNPYVALMLVAGGGALLASAIKAVRQDYR